MKSNDLRPGMCIRFDGKLSIVHSFQHVTPGNLRAFVVLKLKSIDDGAIIERRIRSGEEMEQIDLDRRQMEYLYSDASGHVFMDSATYDQVTVPQQLIGESMGYVKPNTVITTFVNGGNVVAVELPKTVDLQVKETGPGIKGATATNQLKDAVLETGLKTRVPPFIEVGETVRVSTENGAYLSRA